MGREAELESSSLAEGSACEQEWVQLVCALFDMSFFNSKE